MSNNGPISTAQEGSTATEDSRYRIVVGVDFSEIGDTALEQAFTLASATPLAEPHVIHVASAFGPVLRLELTEEIRTVSMREAAEYLRQYVERRLQRFTPPYGGGFERAATHVRVGSAAEQIAQLASDLEADLVVVGTHGRRGIRRLLVGSVAEGVVRLARCPVYVVRPKDHQGALEVPVIEPPCPQCVEARRRSGGQELWCEQHSEHHGRGLLYTNPSPRDTERCR
jgi:nucleotide-binding universal stress UspA family protein